MSSAGSTASRLRPTPPPPARKPRRCNAAAQKALAGEIEARATQTFAGFRTIRFVLATDGVLRWTGDVVGKLIAGDERLRPRVRVIADEHLTGPSRELVQTRLDLWLKTHIEKLLAPLFVLTAAEDVTGMARGVAFQLVEALGVLERQKVAEEVKGLDQPARATLRKYGVRFGAYHIYLPALLKPAPRSLATQLWALKHESPDAKGVDELLRLAASGRTSIPIDKDIAEARFIAPRAIAFAASALCASISWSGLRILSARHCPGAKAHRAPNPTVRSTAAASCHQCDDVAYWRVGRRLRLDLALARLSHGSQAETCRARYIGARSCD